MLLPEVKILFFGVSRDNRTGTSRRRQNNESDCKTKKRHFTTISFLVSDLFSTPSTLLLWDVFLSKSFSCCTNVVALFSFLDFSRNLLTTVFGSEILRQRRECCLLAFPSSKEFTHYIKFVVCVLFGWSNVDVMCSAVGSCRSLREILRFLLITRLRYTSLCSNRNTDFWKSNIWIPKQWTCGITNNQTTSPSNKNRAGELFCQT